MIKVQITLVASPQFEPTPRFSGKDDYDGFAPPLPIRSMSYVILRSLRFVRKRLGVNLGDKTQKTVTGSENPRVGGSISVFMILCRGIAAVVDHFSDAVLKNPIVGQKSKNPQLRAWHTKNLERLPGLKFMRPLWVCDVSGGPFKFAA